MASDGPLERRVDELARRLDRLERRIDALTAAPADADRATSETVRETVSEPARMTPEVTASPRSASADHPLVTERTLPLVGRLLLVLGAGLLLRAITEANVLPRVAGSILGLTYAVAWLAMADRAAARERFEEATFHALATVLIACPLLWEVTVGFHVLPPWAAALALVLIAGLGIGMAWRRHHDIVAWVVLLGATSTAIAIGFGARALFPFMGCLLLLALAALWLEYLCGWSGLAWLVAAATNVVFVFLGAVMLTNTASPLLGGMTPAELVVLQVGLVAVYVGSLVVRTLVQGRSLGMLEMGQAATAFVAGGCGAILVGLSVHVPAHLAGAPIAVLAVGCYAAAWILAERPVSRPRAVRFYGTAALLLTLLAAPLLLARRPMALAFAVAGATLAVVGAQRAHRGLVVHGSVYLFAAAFVSGLVTRTAGAFVGSADALAVWDATPVVVTLLAIAAGAWLSMPEHPGAWGRVARVATASIVGILVLGVGAIVVCATTPLLAGWAHDAAARAASLATLRTGVLAAAAVALIAMGSRGRWADLRWVAYAVAALGAIKLIFEDLRVGRAATLFVSLALYGGALIIVSRLSGRRAKAA